MAVVLPWQRLEFAQIQARPLAATLLVCATPGTGASQFAEALVSSLLCTAAPTGSSREPCGTCPSCHWLEERQHPNLRYLSWESPESNPADPGAESSGKGERPGMIGIDSVRGLSDFLFLSTSLDGPRIVLIDPAEALNRAAANALLKVLEEPPPHTLFLLVSTQPALLPTTIRSRCQQLRLSLPSFDTAALWLQEQGIKSPHSLLAWAGGAPLAALNQVRQDSEPRLRWLRQICDPRLTLSELSATTIAASPTAWVDWLQRWVYDLIQVRLVGHPSFHPDEDATLRQQQSRFSLETLLQWELQLRDARRLQRHTLNPRLWAEGLLAPLFEPQTPTR